jgi:ribonuclease Z
MKVTVLGSAAGIPTPERGLPAILVEVDGELVLFDCGEGTQRQMMKAGYGLCSKMRIFITHLHGDHIFGLPGMIQTMNLLNRIHPLEIYGPPGLKEFIEETTVATMSEPVFSLSIYEVSEGEIFKGKRYIIEGAWVDHSRATMAYRMVVGGSLGKFKPRRARVLGVPEGPLWSELKSGRKITLKDGRVIEPKNVLGEPVPGKIFVYSGDTRYSPNIIKLARGADMLIHEGTLASELKDWAEMEGHSTAEVAAKVAKEAGVKRLILTHISARYLDVGVRVDEAKRIFPKTEVTQDLKVYKLKS